MANEVDWITWKTDPSEIVNPDKVNEKIDCYFQEYNTYMNPIVYEQIKYELEKGGLTNEALNISGTTPAHEIALDIINKIDEIKESVTNLQSDIYKTLKEQKEIEKKQLINEINNCIEKENILLENIKNKKEVEQNIYNMGEDSNDIIMIINDRIRKLKKRLEMAESL